MAVRRIKAKLCLLSLAACGKYALIAVAPRRVHADRIGYGNAFKAADALQRVTHLLAL
ncbi:hypothetical protein SDC9_200309 [bioreactor metagenome]|uniref:Uncharacterized protein n=1 Tax=bioreactor metagenome TaxID=1076179 RepID=A0A645IN10_9ZZZZ